MSACQDSKQREARRPICLLAALLFLCLLLALALACFGLPPGPVTPPITATFTTTATGTATMTSTTTVTLTPTVTATATSTATFTRTSTPTPTSTSTITSTLTPTRAPSPTPIVRPSVTVTPEPVGHVPWVYVDVPKELLFVPEYNWLLAVSYNTNSVAVLNAATLKEIKRVSAGAAPWMVARADNVIYVGDTGSNKVSFFWLNDTVSLTSVALPDARPAWLSLVVKFTLRSMTKGRSRF